MQRIKSIEALQRYRKKVSGRIGLVPTMGALHAGHLSLVTAAQNANTKRTNGKKVNAKNDNDLVVVSIFVNPTQFNKSSDLEKYPNTLEADLQQLEAAGVDAVFLPNFEMIYPDNYQFQLTENSLSKLYCGAHRPGHFDGVLSVVMKLFNLIKPDYAYFGEKDYQQLSLIKGMVQAFFLNVKIVSCPIIREADGLAMSSRNLRLTPIERKIAPQFYATLISDTSLADKKQQLASIGFDVDYLEVMDDRLLAAASLGEIRLIDNVPLDTLTHGIRGTSS